AHFRAQRDKLHGRNPRKQVSPRELDRAEALIARLTEALKPLEALAKTATSFPQIAACHYKAIAALSQDDTDRTVGFAGTDGAALELVFNEIAKHQDDAAFGMMPSDYPDFFRAAISDKVARRPDLPGTRVHIYGLLEARLQTVDRLVLGGLVEGTWPP